MTNKDKAPALNEYEKEMLDAYEKGELQAVKSETDYRQIAKNTMKKNRKINIRISENDLSALRRRAAREGIPYQRKNVHRPRRWPRCYCPALLTLPCLP